MDRQRVRAWEAQCTQEQPAACVATCPVHVDVRTMVDRVRKGDLSGGLAVFARTIPFPRTISRICDRPCESACKRVEAGEAIRIRALERACVDLADEAPASPRRLPRKEKRVAVVGAGLSGLTAALDLALKGYQVVVFEAGRRPGGRTREYPEQVLSPRALDADLEILQDLGVEVHCDSPVGNAEGARVRLEALTSDFDAVYLGLGPGSVKHLALGLALGEDGRIRMDSLTFATSLPKVFAGGGQRGSAAAYSPITSLQDGRYAALSIDRLLQKASLTASRDQQGSFTTRLFTSTRGIEPLPAVVPGHPPQGYTSAEAADEARRCLSCQCLECVKACEYLAHHGSYPKRYVRQIYNNDCIVMGSRPLNRMINSCALCGLCEAVCPEKLSMGEVCREARQSMVRKGKMPPSAHDFALRDLAFSKGEHFALARHAPGHASSSAVFFPGCQLSASSPDHVARLYDHLRARVPGGVGLHLGCCGAPADWAARRELFDETLREIARTWAEMGSPRIITACSSCYRVFKGHLPDVKVESLWTLLADLDLPHPAPPSTPRLLALHDPCASRGDGDVQDGVRQILAGLGVLVEELRYSRELTTCCGFGGLMSFANPQLADEVVARRIAEHDADYVTYCAMCRDNFSRKGKRAVHVLDLVFGAANADAAARPAPTYSQRHENRARLKARLLREVWGEEAQRGERPMNLVIRPELLALMEKRMILVEDLEKVVAHAEATGEKLEDSATGHFIASHRPASVTYWVEYSVEPSGILVHNAYSHRMEII